MANVPHQPKNLAARAGDKEVVLTWNSVVGASKIIIKSSAKKTGSFKQVGEVKGNATTFTHTGLKNDKEVFYIVVAANKNGEGISSDVTSATPQAPTIVVTAKPANAKTSKKNDEDIIEAEVIEETPVEKVKKTAQAVDKATKPWLGTIELTIEVAALVVMGIGIGQTGNILYWAGFILVFLQMLVSLRRGQ